MAWHIPVWHWLAHAALGSLLILGAGGLAVRFSRQPIRRLRLIELSLLGCLLFPLLLLVPGLPRWSVGALPAPAEAQAPQPPAGPEVAAAPQTLPPSTNLPQPGENRAASAARTRTKSAAQPHAAVVATPAVPTSNEPGPAPLSWSTVLGLVVAGYLLGAAFLALRMLVGLVRLFRLYRTALPAPAEIRDLFEQIAGPAGAGVRLLVSGRIDSPLTFGGARPVILLPAGLCRAHDEAALRFGLAHEWSHIERRDVRVWNLASLGQVLFFYQPLFWWLRRQLRLCQDFLADARAADQAERAEDYASYLVRLARRRLGAVSLAALGVSDRRSNLYRRIIMLVQNREPLERRCPRLWNGAATLVALALLVGVAGLRLQADDKPKDAKPAPKASKEAVKALTYSGIVVEKGTGKPLAGATVTVRRSLLGDPRYPGNKVIQETKHQTDAKGKYSFTIPPEQVAEKYLYIELDVSHPTHATQAGFGYALSMILKNEKIGGRPFFEKVELQPGEAVTGQVQLPDGKPAAGVKILAYSRTNNNDFREYGSFATTHTDARGNFRINVVKGGLAVFWILPQKYAPSTHVVKKKGDQGLYVLQPGIRLTGKVLDAKGKPVAGVWVNASRTRQPTDDEIFQRVADSIRRSARTNAKGEFEMNPLPPGEYEVKPGEHGYDSSLEGRQPTIVLPAVFLGQKVTLKEGEKPEPLVARAVPHVVIEAQCYDGKGKKTRSHEFFVFGQLDKKFWFSQGHVDAQGKITALVPHGLTNTQLDLMTNEHGVLRWRKTPGGPLNNSRRVDLGTVNDDVKGIQIIRYVAPIVIVKVKARDGKKIKDVAVTAHYPKGKGQFQGGLIVKKGLTSDVSFEEQEDGRFRSMQLFPDQEVTITAQADGYKPGSLKIQLPEGAQKDVEIVLEKK